MENYNTQNTRNEDTFEQEFSSMLKPKYSRNLYNDKLLNETSSNTSDDVGMKRVSSSISSNLNDKHFTDDI